MTTREEYEDASEWLNLSLPSNPSSTAQSVSDRTPKKVFSCNYCMRKFYNSQALGGHQNAHKRERGAMRRYHYSQAMMSYMNYPVNPPMAGSLGAHGYSLVSNTARERSSMVENLTESSQRGQSWRSHHHLHHHIVAETAAYMWPGSFRIEQQTQGETLDHQTELDLNLKL